ncbi:MAG: DUF721 domain-containing protein [Phycisphaerales bacterium]|nr:MAG: DUF721 domain-containing protein [Phycisphaerales bacterium]
MLSAWVWKNRQWWPARKAPAVPIGELVGQLRESPWLAEPATQSRLAEVVAGTLTPSLAAHVSVGGVKAGHLVVTVDDPAYRFEIQNYWYTRILGAVQAAAPEARVDGLKFVLDLRRGCPAGRRLR